MRTLCLLLLATQGAIAAAPVHPHYFEPADSSRSTFTGRGFGYSVELSAASARIAGPHAKPLSFRLENASSTATLRGEDPLGSRAHYLIGDDPRKWRTNVPHFARVRTRDVYPGTDMAYYPGPQGLEFDFILAPSANPSRIHLRFDRRIAIAPDGVLRDAASGERLLDAPHAYELDSAGGRHLVPSRFRTLGRTVASFAVERSVPSRTLVIDPVLMYATFLGGSGFDTMVAAERGPDGGLYVAGHTASLDLPQAVSLNSILNRPISLNFTDAFVARYTADGSALAYIVYIGGTKTDVLTSLAIDPQGRATIAGFSYSDNFPTTAGAFQRDLGGRDYDGYCLRLSPDGSAIEYSTFLRVVSPTRGYLAPFDRLRLLAGVDSQGTAIVAGTNYVFSPFTALGVEATPGALQQTPKGGVDGFLMRLNNAGTGLVYATWYGGSGDDQINGLAVDAVGNAYLAGSSNSNDLPLAHPFQTVPPTNSSGGASNGNTAGFFARITADGRSVSVGSYYGGQRSDSTMTSIALDGVGNIYLGGASPVSAAPGLAEVPGPSTIYAANSPGFLLKLDPSGQFPQYTWAYSTLGLSGVSRVRVDSSSRPCVLGRIVAQQVTAGALYGGRNDGAGITCLEADGKTIRYATLPPDAGLGNISAVDFAFDAAGNAVVASSSRLDANYTSVLPVTADAPQPVPGAYTEGYIFKISPNNPLPKLYYVSPYLLDIPTSSTISSQEFTVSGADFAPGVQVFWNDTILPTNSVASGGPGILRFQLPTATLLQQPHRDQRLTVSLPAPGGGTSNALTVKYLNRPPGGLTVSPAVVPVGAGDVTLTVSGSFTTDCTVTWDGRPQAVVRLNLAQPSFQFPLPASSFAQPADHVISVTNPPPGGGVATVHVAVTPTGLPQSIPAITSAVIVGVGQAGITQTLSGRNFIPSDVTVIWNGSDRPTTVSGTNIQFVLNLNDVSRMGSAVVQLRSGGVLSPAVTAYIGVKISSLLAVADAARGRTYFITANPAGQFAVLASVAIPSGNLLQTLDLGANGIGLSLTDDNRFLYVLTLDGRVRRMNLDTFAWDTTITLPAPASGSFYFGGNPSAVPVAGNPDTVIAAGIDGVIRIFDGGVARQNTTANLLPDPGILSPVFATPGVVWANLGSPNTSWCMARLQYDATGFTSLAKTCTDGLTGPWGLPADEVKYDSGAVWFESGPRTLVWKSPRTGTLDIASRRIFSSVATQNGLSGLAIYSLDTEEQIAAIPQSGYLPSGQPVPYGSKQVLWNYSSALLLIDLP